MSSLVFLGFSVIMFLLSYGIMFVITPIVLGTFYSAAANVHIADPNWQQTYTDTEAVTRYITPLIPTVGLFIFIIKVIMVAAVRGRD